MVEKIQERTMTEMVLTTVISAAEIKEVTTANLIYEWLIQRQPKS
jgi:hypothetical protein